MHSFRSFRSFVLVLGEPEPDLGLRAAYYTTSGWSCLFPCAAHTWFGFAETDWLFKFFCTQLSIFVSVDGISFCVPDLYSKMHMPCCSCTIGWAELSVWNMGHAVPERAAPARSLLVVHPPLTCTRSGLHLRRPRIYTRWTSRDSESKSWVCLAASRALLVHTL